MLYSSADSSEGDRLFTRVLFPFSSECFKSSSSFPSNGNLFLFWEFLARNSMQVACFVMVSSLTTYSHKSLVFETIFLYLFTRLWTCVNNVRTIRLRFWFTIICARRWLIDGLWFTQFGWIFLLRHSWRKNNCSRIEASRQAPALTMSSRLGVDETFVIQSPSTVSRTPRQERTNCPGEMRTV